MARLRQEIVGAAIFPDLPPEILERTEQITLTKVEGGWTIKSHPGLKHMLTNPAYIGHVCFCRADREIQRPSGIVMRMISGLPIARRRTLNNPIERPEGATKRYSRPKAPSMLPAGRAA